jgi:hypothetical protein
MRKWIKSFASRNVKLIAVCSVLALTLVAVGVATPAVGGPSLKKISKRLKRMQAQIDALSSQQPRDGAQGPQGQPGATGATGATGAAGANATYQGPHWGLIARNTSGDAVGALRAGPFVGPTVAPPFGDGSLGIQTTNTNKVAFGNEVDFFGDPVGGLDELGFHIYKTGEDVAKGANNNPNITLEIDPSVGGVNYTSMVYNAQDTDTVVNGWSDYIDTTDAATANRGFWFTNATVRNATGCSQASFCSLAQAQAALVTNNDGGAPASILTLGVGKGTDFEFQGAVDGLQVNDTVYDFEPFGVGETTP